MAYNEVNKFADNKIVSKVIARSIATKQSRGKVLILLDCRAPATLRLAVARNDENKMRRGRNDARNRAESNRLGNYYSNSGCFGFC